MKTFTKEDLYNAFEAGQTQKSAEWTNDKNSTRIACYDPDEDMDFDSWFNKNYINK
jgi:hypothetical protein